MVYVPHSEKIQKLLILYITEEFIFPLTEDQFVKIILDNEFMNYIEYKSYLNDLMDTKQIKREEIAGQKVYVITEDGSNTLKEFIDLLPISPKEAFHEYVSKNLHKIKKETLLDSSFKYTKDGQTEITCNIRENNSLLMSLKIYMNDGDTARQICNNWEAASPMMYKIIMDILLKS